MRGPGPNLDKKKWAPVKQTFIALKKKKNLNGKRT